MTGERKFKNNETNLTGMRDGVYMYLQHWPGMIISVLLPKHQACQEGRKGIHGWSTLCLCIVTPTIATLVPFTVLRTTPVCEIPGTRNWFGWCTKDYNVDS